MNASLKRLLPRRLNRRAFLRWGSLASAALLAPACAPSPQPPAQPSSTPEPSATPPPATVSPTVAATATRRPTRTPTPDARPTVAIIEAGDYREKTVRAQARALVDALGGLGNLIRPGAKVGIKTNLTGTPAMDRPDKPPAIEYYVTHPAVVGALSELFFEAGAKQVWVVDGLGDASAWEKWGYREMAQKTGVELVDLCQPDPYPNYISYSTGPNPLIYDHFMLNPVLAEFDVFVSVAKLKPHSTTGVTLSMKNLVGLTPIELYKNNPEDTARAALHGSGSFDQRMPRVIMDLNRACPIHLAVIDGIAACEGGPGPWQAIRQVWPGVLIGGFNPVAVDAVGAAVMGFDPEAKDGEPPYLHGENHLALAASLGLGPHRLKDIHLTGAALEDVRTPYQPAP